MQRTTFALAVSNSHYKCFPIGAVERALKEYLSSVLSRDLHSTGKCSARLIRVRGLQQQFILGVCWCLKW